MPNRYTKAVILGAGFSANAGLPVARDFAKSLLNNELYDNTDNTVINDAINEIIKLFLNKTFNWHNGDDYPSFEDIFTLIDLSANSGHYLGNNFSPKQLRAIRRFLIYRLFQILNKSHPEADDTVIPNFLNNSIDINNNNNESGFIVLNWDIVLENNLFNTHKVDYGIDAEIWDQSENNQANQHKISVAKIHGSSNWVYCDNCRKIYYKTDEKVCLSINAGLKKEDFESFHINTGSEIQSNTLQEHSNICGAPFEPHIATFSYKKSFRTHAFMSSWHLAEKILTEAREWIFVGYSLPEADYEFKHLLKTCQLKSILRDDNPPKKIKVILKNDDWAVTKYKTFFGNTNDLTICNSGLSEYVSCRSM